ncbi:hypothetical protein [Paenibacillus sp. SYP-B4298]|uniref:hypothetical protein n=1 Tax=Paenibacillus sp. SYP-B4298 TaxID=2996034 RepID=UPI0022DCEB71|nr:hypothetical protein [Paenibacillus sp. SYP-B4298]
MPTLINYNRGLVGNQAGLPVPPAVNLPVGVDTLLVTLGIYVAQPTNFLEILSTIGSINAAPTSLVYTVTVDGIPSGSAFQSVTTATQSDTTAFQTILTNVPVGHHVIQLFGRSTVALATANGPITISASVYA